MRPGTFALITFGCRVNQADSLSIEGDLRSRGWTPAPAETASTVIVNTCSVTASADQGARQAVRRVARMNPAARIVVTGCYATRQPDEIAALPNVARIVPNTSKDEVAAILVNDGEGPTTAQRFGDGEGSCGAPLSPGAMGRTALTLRIQTGCEERCSYCIIPSTRGAGRSVPREEVLARIARAVAAGYKEIVLTGVHLGSYGRDLEEGSSLGDLLRELGGDRPATTDGARPRVGGDVLFRISSLEPMDCTPAIVGCVQHSPRLAPHFHLPLQHGSDRILRAMRRPYDASFYAALVHDIASRMPHASIGSDIIVGFPGETDRDFDTMCALLERLPLSHLHVFPYSDRPGTEASRLPDKVDGSTIRERGRIVREIGASLSRRFRSSQLGTTHRALTVDDGRAAVTANYLKVALDVPQPRNEWVTVRVEAGEPLRGVVV